MAKERIENIYNTKTVNDYYDFEGWDIEAVESLADYDKYLLGLLPKDLTGKIILDLGCGNGKYSQLLCDRGAEKVVGLDLSEEMLIEARKRREEKDLKKFEILRGDIIDLPFSAESFDIVFSRYSLMYGKNIDAIIKNISKIIKPGGELYALITNINIKKIELTDKIRGTIIPRELKINDRSVLLKNYGHTLDDYKIAIEKAGLNLINDETFPITKPSVPQDYKYKDFIDFYHTALNARRPK